MKTSAHQTTIGLRSPTVAAARGRRGSTLIETLLSVAIAGLIAAGIQTSLYVSMKGLPNPEGSAQSTIKASKVVDQLSTELESAVYITEHTATTLGFTLPDRDGDGIAERVRYAWTGTPGGPLTRQYNGGTVTVLSSSVSLFNLTPSYTSVTENYTGLAGEVDTESLLIDYSSGSGTGNRNVTSSSTLGQYFTLTLPANAYAWRPTRVQFMARRSSTPAVTQVQMRTANANLTPTATVLEEYTLSDTALGSSYNWESYSFTQLEPIASGGGICLILKRTSGNTSVVVQENNGTGELTGTILNIWSYNSNKSLNCQLFGKLSLSGIPKSFNSNYLTAMGISLQIHNAAPVLQTTGVTLNHPELLSGKWELKFDQNPTGVDINGDALGDWNLRSGTTFDMASISNGVWTTTGTQLDTAPDCDFARTTIVDLRLQNTTVGGSGATFAMNALRSGSTCAPILVNLKKQADGTQTLTLSKKISDATPQTLISLTGLAAQFVDLHLIIDPVQSAVCIMVNGVERGTFAVNRFVSADTSRRATIGASGSTAKFSYAAIRVLEQ